MSGAGVAVVIPCLDKASWLADAIESVQRQTYPVAELVVVDDGSTDGSAELAERCGAWCIRQPRAGPAAARNRGVAATAATWIAFLDADDRFAPSKIEAQVAQLGATGAVLSCTDAWVLRGGTRGTRKNAGMAVPDDIDLWRLLKGNPMICSSVVIAREAFVGAGGFDEDPELVSTEDYDLWLRVAAVGRLAYLDQPLVDYRIVPGQLSDNERFVRGVDRIMAKVVAAHGAGVAALASRRRAGVRLDSAFDLVRSGHGRAARRRIAEARALGAGWRATVRPWLRSWWPR